MWLRNLENEENALLMISLLTIFTKNKSEGGRIVTRIRGSRSVACLSEVRFDDYRCSPGERIDESQLLSLADKASGRIRIPPYVDSTFLYK